MTTLIDALIGLRPWLVLVLVFALPAAEAGLLVGVFIPGETAVLLGGVVAHGGGLPLWAVIVAASAGAACGDQAGFLLGRSYGNRLVDHLPALVRRSGDLDRALDLIRRRGALAVALGRWAAVLRALVPGAAGTSGMAQLRFTVANVIGGTLWAVVISVAGYLVGASYRSLSSNLGLAGDASRLSSCSSQWCGGSGPGGTAHTERTAEPVGPDSVTSSDFESMVSERVVRRPPVGRLGWSPSSLSMRSAA